MKNSIFDVDLLKRMRSLWKFSLVLYIICSIAFLSKSTLMMLNSIALYLFLGVSFICILLKKTVKINIYLAFTFVFLLYIIIGTLYNNNQSMAMSIAYEFFVVVCMLFCIYNYVESEEDIVLVFKTVMFGGLVLNIYTVFLYGGGIFDALVNEARVGGLAGNLNFVGMKSAYSALIAMFFLLNGNISLFKKVTYSTIIVFCSFFALITASRKVLLLLVAGVFFLFLFRKNKKRKPLAVFKNFVIAIACAAVVLLIIFNVDYFDDIAYRFEEMLNLFINGSGEVGSDKKRIRYIKTGLEVFVNNPVLGDGTAASYNYFNTYSHCNFVEILMNNGIIGFILFYFCYPIFFVKAAKKIRDERKTDTNMSLLCLLVVLSIVLLSFGFVYYTMPYFQILIAASFSYVAFSKKTEADT